MSVYSNDDEIPECPLCMEPLGLDDLNFYPCACRYQVCRFCWHRIRTDENGLCPHCREPYAENPAEYIPLTQDQMVKMKSEKKQKTIEKKQKLLESRKNLASVRVVQKNLVFVIGLSPRLADAETLKKPEYFGKYGKIYKVVINNSTVYNGAQGPSVSAYVTYHRHEDASKAIQAVNNAYIDGRYLKASFGTTKYCTFFLRGVQCTKTDCMYLHELGDEEASFTKEDMQMGKHQLYETATLGATNTVQGEASAATLGVAMGVANTAVGVANTALTVANVTLGVANNSLVSKELKRSSSHPATTCTSRESSLCESVESNGTSLEGADPALSATASWSTSTGVAQPSMTQTSTQSKERGSQHPREPKSSRHHHHHHHKQQGHKQQVAPPPSHDDLRLQAKVDSSSSLSFGCDQTDQDGVSPPASPGGCGTRLEQEQPAAVAGGIQVSTSRQQLATRITTRTSTGSVGSTPSVSPSSSMTTSSSSSSIGVEREASKMDVHVCVPPGVPKAAMDTGDAPQSSSSSNQPTSVSRPQAHLHEGVPSPVNAILGSAGTGQFGCLGVSWNGPVPEAHPPSEDDLGFDPWDVSNKGLADLLEAEASNRHPVVDVDEKQRLASVSYVTHGPTANGSHGPTANGNSKEHCRLSELVAKEKSCDPSLSLTSWQEEFRALFPNVNISFGGSSMNTSLKSEKSFSSLSDAVDGSRGSPFQPVHGTGFGYGYNALPRSTSEGEWPDLESSQLATKWTTIENSSVRQQGASIPPPPPGFTAKNKAAVTSVVTSQQWPGQPAATRPGLNLQTTNAILQTNQLLQNWMRLQYPNLGTDFALAGQQLSRNPALYQQFQHLARLQQLQQSQSLLLQGHTLLPAMAAPSATGQPFLGQQTLGLLGQSFYPGSSSTIGTQQAAVQRTNSGVVVNQLQQSMHSAALN